MLTVFGVGDMRQHKRSLLTAVSLLALSSPALAHESEAVPTADAYENDVAPTAVSPSPSWSGAYGAIGGGGRFAFGDLSVVPTAVGKMGMGMVGGPVIGDFSDAAAFGTVELGYDIVTNGPADRDIIFGVVGNFDFGSNEDSLATVGMMGAVVTVGSWDIRSSWGIGARAGFLASPTTLVYGLGGFTMADIETTAFTGGMMGGVATSSNDSASGFFVGGGVETMLTDTVAFKLEYRYSSYDR